MAAAKTPSPTLASSLEDTIRRDVVSGRLPPGAKLKQRELTEHYGCGTIPLREALSRLSAAGYVEAEDRRGFRVAPISVPDLEAMTRVRRQVEIDALTASMAHGDVAWEGRVLAALHCLNRLEITVSDDGTSIDPAWEDAHTEFHHALVSACPSPWLLALAEQLRDQAARYRNLSIRASRSPLRDVREEHERIATAAVARDTAEATRLLAAHIDATSRLVEQHVGEHVPGAGDTAAKS